MLSVHPSHFSSLHFGGKLLDKVSFFFQILREIITMAATAAAIVEGKRFQTR
jgi:hypothetical protein